MRLPRPLRIHTALLVTPGKSTGMLGVQLPEAGGWTLPGERPEGHQQENDLTALAFLGRGESPIPKGAQASTGLRAMLSRQSPRPR